MSAEKNRGDTFERAVVTILKANGHPHAERALMLGHHTDHGDIALPGFYVDCKNHARLELGTWMTEARDQAAALNPLLVPVVIAKRRGASAARAYAVTELADFARLTQ